MKKLIYLFILIAAGISVCAQPVPGYRGKKTFVDYRINATPALRHPTYLNKIASSQRGSYPRGTADESSFIPFNTTHNITIERVTGRKFSLAATYSFAASKEYANFSEYIYNPQLGKSGLYTFSDCKMNVFGHYFTGSLVFYGRNALAPYGKYFKITAGYCGMSGRFTESTYKAYGVENYVTTEMNASPSVNKFKSNAFGWGFSFGLNRIYKDCIVINRGVSFFLPLRSVDVTNGNIKNDVNWYISDRLHARDIASIYLGIGYLF